MFFHLQIELQQYILHKITFTNHWLCLIQNIMALYSHTMDSHSHFSEIQGLKLTSLKEYPSLHVIFCKLQSDPMLLWLTHNVFSHDFLQLPYLAKDSQVSWLSTYCKTYLLHQALAKGTDYTAGSSKCPRYLLTNKICFLTLKCFIYKWILCSKSPNDFKQIGNMKRTVTNTRFSFFFCYTSLNNPKAPHLLLTVICQASS